MTNRPAFADTMNEMGLDYEKTRYTAMGVFYDIVFSEALALRAPVKSLQVEDAENGGFVLRVGMADTDDDMARQVEVDLSDDETLRPCWRGSAEEFGAHVRQRVNTALKADMREADDDDA